MHSCASQCDVYTLTQHVYKWIATQHRSVLIKQFRQNAWHEVLLKSQLRWFPQDLQLLAAVRRATLARETRLGKTDLRASLMPQRRPLHYNTTALSSVSGFASTNALLKIIPETCFHAFSDGFRSGSGFGPDQKAHALRTNFSGNISQWVCSL